jgi:hypothetical protein
MLPAGKLVALVLWLRQPARSVRARRAALCGSLALRGRHRSAHRLSADPPQSGAGPSANPGEVPSRRLGLPIALAAVGCVLALAACGSSGSPSSAAGTGSGDTLALQFADCMRSHGVPTFPDPGSPGGGPGSNSAINKQSPAFVSAEQACNKLQPGGRPKGTPLPEAQRVAALAWAQCIRTHGVPELPDPTFPNSGGMFIGVAPGFNPQSPAFKQAQAACGSLPRPAKHAG